MKDIEVYFNAPYACFTRPELKSERMSYDCLTPSAARNMLQAIYWKPSIEYNIVSITVINPINFITLKRNEIKSKASKGSSLFIEDDRTQRNSLILKDVAYVVKFNLSLTTKAGNNHHKDGREMNQSELDNDKNIDKHYAILLERIKSGACFMQPYMGNREFSASFRLASDDDKSQLQGEQSLGLMLRDVEVKVDLKKKELYTPLFFKASLKDGVMEVPPIAEALR